MEGNALIVSHHTGLARELSGDRKLCAEKLMNESGVTQYAP